MLGNVEHLTPDLSDPSPGAQAWDQQLPLRQRMENVRMTYCSRFHDFSPCSVIAGTCATISTVWAVAHEYPSYVVAIPALGLLCTCAVAIQARQLAKVAAIKRSAERLLKTTEKVQGLGKKRLELIKNCWLEQKSIRDVMVFLQGHGVSPAFAQKIFKNYGPQSVKKVTENPYKLARDIHGIGFKIADDIAQNLGIAKDSSARIEAGIEHILSENSNEGHVCCPLPKLTKDAAALLECSSEAVLSALQGLQENKHIKIEAMVHQGEPVAYAWLNYLFLSELGIARQLLRLHQGKSTLRSIDISKALIWVQEKLKITLAENQKQAVESAMKEKVQIITGGPGTGKSTITKAILAIAEHLTSKIILSAPTGRAAKRMTEITGQKARTIHSLLEYNFKKGQFLKGYDNPLDCDLIIVDEASMIDTSLMYSLLKAVPTHARIIFVGDINQLPSVGAGNVLKDMISSQKIPLTALNEIFRQAAGSKIITNAHKVNSGIFPDLHNANDGDFFFIDAPTPEAVLRDVVTLVAERLPKKYRLNAFDDIQVLSPMRRGIIGTENLNLALQERLNPDGKDSILWAGRHFFTGDKVMQIRNDYKREVYNGDIGRIASIDHEEKQVIVIIDDKEVIYDFSDLDQLVLAYAVSIHKYQGSESTCVVIPIHTTHFKLLSRNILYTGITRGKKLVCLVGTKQAVGMAVKNDEVKGRYTGLKEVLNEMFSYNLNRQFPL